MPDHPPIDPEIAFALTAPDVPPPSLQPHEIADARARAVANTPDREHLTRGGAITVTEMTIPGPADHPMIDVLVLAPTDRPADAPAPGIVFIHGGGMMMGTRRHLDDSMLDAVELGCHVLSPEYRLAPEHPYPAPIDDCYAAWRHIAGHATEYGIDPGRLAIAGSSAGGGLAAGVALLARDRGGPLPFRQILYCPMLDDREITSSSRELEGEGRWDRIANRTGWDAYLGDRRAAADVPTYAAPARATDLTGLPPAFLDVGDVETFRDEDIDYAARLSRAGVPVELHLWPGGVHGFTGLAPGAAVSRAAMATRRSYLERMLGSPG